MINNNFQFIIFFIINVQLNALTMLSVRKELLKNVPQFNQSNRVFAIQKDRRGTFLYK